MFNIFKKEVVMVDEMSFNVKMCHKEPVDVIDMANSLIALSELVASRIGSEHGVEGVKIVLSGVKEGSDVYQLGIVLASATLPFAEHANAIFTFTDFLTKFKNIGEKSLDQIQNDNSVTVETATKIKAIVKPIVSDGSASFHITTGDNSPVTILSVSHNDALDMVKNANTVQKIKAETTIIEEKSEFEKVLIRMHKTTNEAKKKVRDFAYCDDIVKGKAIATIIENMNDKEQILEDPYNNLFLVDIEVAKEGDKVKLYRVTKLHNIVPIEDD